MNSNFVNLSDYCVLEYRSTPLGDPNPSILSSDYFLVDNKNVNTLQIYNTDGYSDITHNSRDLSVVSVGGSKAVYNDITLIPIYTQYDPNITETQLSSGLSSNLVMDTVRVHFASGFNFTEVENIIIGVKHKLNDLGQIQLANVLLDAATAQSIFTYNTRPLFLANTIYDRYVDIKIPSPAWLDEDFTQFGSSSFEWAITNGIGFIKGAPLSVFLAEATYEEYNAPNNVTYDRYQIVNYYEGSISQINKFDGLGCHLLEATDGDYLEFFATWNGAFPDALIDTLNDSGPDQDWFFTHQLEVYEQIGSTLVPSGNVIVYQESAFDKVLTYRPILKEAGFAVSMSIDYTLRLINRKNGDQIIRTGSLSVINPNKYGKSLAKITLPDGPQSMKVYNKIIQKNFETGSIFAPKSTQVDAGSQVTAEVITKTIERKIPEYIPIKQSAIRLSQKNALNRTGNVTDQVIYGQGRMTLPIDPTDNIIQFTVYQADPSNRQPNKQTKVNLNNNSEFRLNFGEGTEFAFSTIVDATLTNPSLGEIAFRVPKDQAKLILASTDALFTITLISKADGTESLLYTGKWTSSANYADVISAGEDAASAASNEELIAALSAQVTALTEANVTLRTKLLLRSNARDEKVSYINAAAASAAKQ
jgi:hypothetical protein